LLKQSDFIAVYGKDDGRAIKKGYTARIRDLSGAISKYINSDINIADAVKMMTETPARILNLNTKGQIKEGFDADIILFDENINIKTVIVNGKKEI
jgi:N-acetylglucosamine-6-phosphate deacetylase